MGPCSRTSATPRPTSSIMPQDGRPTARYSCTTPGVTPEVRRPTHGWGQDTCRCPAGVDLPTSPTLSPHDRSLPPHTHVCPLPFLPSPQPCSESRHHPDSCCHRRLLRPPPPCLSSAGSRGGLPRRVGNLCHFGQGLATGAHAICGVGISDYSWLYIADCALLIVHQWLYIADCTSVALSDLSIPFFGVFYGQEPIPN